MGVYNPNVPRIVGQEWVGIRNEDLVFSPSINVVEYGHTFTPSTSRALSTGKFYIHQFPEGAVGNQAMLLGVYPSGREALSGPIHSVTIPCNSLSVTGTVGDGTTPSVSSLLSPGDPQYIATSPSNNTSSKALDLYFGTSQFSQLLAGKRIVKVELLHQLSWTPINAGTTIVSDNPPFLDTLTQSLAILQTGVTFANAFLANYAPLVTYFGCGLNFLGNGIQLETNAVQTEITSVNFGEVHPLSGATLGRPGGRYPWRYEDLANFEATAGVNRLSVHYEFGASTQVFTGTYYLGYAALRVWYCEETRVAYAGEAFGGTWSISPRNYVLGSNAMTFVDTSRNANPILQGGQQYTVTVSAPDIGDIQGAIATPLTVSAASNPYPTLSALRELNTDPVHVGLKVNLTQTEGESFTREVTHILPQISLHVSGSSQPFPEVHAYGRQAISRVYGNITATQNILDSAIGGAANFTQVRFYARRFGNTTIPLTLSGPGGVSTPLTPAAWDALPRLVDNWKEVTLSLNTASSMGTGTIPTFTWSATGELPGNRWEVLGVTAPALSGTPASLLTQDVVQLGSATYGQPVSGAIIELGWMPGYSVPVSGTTLDSTSDAVLMFSQDMPTVTGFTVVTSNQPLTGVALNCTSYPWYVPNAMAYNNITWSPTSSSVPVTGFGYYELQRMDAIDTTWSTIAQMTSPNASGFKDYEARVGIASSYRIRSVNSLLFAGAWSSTSSSTFNAPGVTGTGMGANARALLFTSNQAQNGARNLAYAIAADNSGSEGFSFPEAAFTQFQFMYGRDYQTAFRPLERGGVTFQRTVLVQAAAISPPTLENFTSLRDLAWDSLPYVCVRDEDGNRWFANVAVPQGSVKANNRTIYMADLNIVQVTNTPAVTVV